MKFEKVLNELRVKNLNENLDLADLAKDSTSLNAFILRAQKLKNNKDSLNNYLKQVISSMRDLNANNLKIYIPIIDKKLPNNPENNEIISQFLLLANEKLKNTAIEQEKISAVKASQEKIRGDTPVYDGVIY